VKRRQALARIAAPRGSPRGRACPASAGPPAHDVGRRAFRRFTAAILGFGTVLPGLGQPALHRPYRAAFAALALSRPAIEGSPP